MEEEKQKCIIGPPIDVLTAKDERTITEDIYMPKSATKPNAAARKLMGQILTEVIARSGVPIPEIAATTHISRQHLYRVQEGTYNPPVDVIGNIFEACNTSLEEYLRRQSSYGSDRKIHADLQQILSYGGKHAVTIRTVIETMVNAITKEMKEDSK